DASTVLIDFGVASRFSPRGAGERIGTATAFAGSLAYASPQQLRGAFVDARADLYSLGCMLYEVLTGDPPFRGRHQEIITGHLRRVPVAPREIDADVPVALNELTMTLLA